MLELIQTIFNGLGIFWPVKIQDKKFHIDEAALPKQRIDGLILNTDKSPRCKLIYKENVMGGEYGIIQKAVRNSKVVVAVKRPRKPEITLESEAILQMMAHETAERAGLHGSIPRILDLFLYGYEIRFAMDWVEGINCVSFFNEKQNLLSREAFDALFKNVILQIAAILYVLENVLDFDHRDLNPSNLWIRSAPTKGYYKIPIGTATYEIPFEFQVVLLDFGFSCMGNTFSLGGRSIPIIDPCPKEGRDMYQIINQFLMSPVIENYVSKEFQGILRELISPFQIQEPYLTLVTVSDKNFRLESLTPKLILEHFAKRV